MTSPTKVLIFGDVAIPTGFGRIGAAVGRYLTSRGYQVVGACIQYDGLLPAPTGVPFFVGALAGKDHGQAISGIWSAFRPDVMLSLQDFPYHIMLRDATQIDWSMTAHVVITPVDGVPIAPDWVRRAKEFDALLTISEFGVEAFRNQQQRAVLCPPGVDTAEFHPLPDDQRAELRANLGLPANAYVVGMMAMNQGRKDFPGALAGFWEAFKDAPDAYLYLDCDRISPAGWNLPEWVLPQIGIPQDRVRYREDAIRAGIVGLNERYGLLDQHMVIAHREGFGLPHIEAMAAGVPTAALDYCSGAEVTQHGTTGLLIPALEHTQIGTWGGGQDRFVDVQALAQQLRWLYDNQSERVAMAARALKYAQTRTWDAACKAVEAEIVAALERRQKAGTA